MSWILVLWFNTAQVSTRGVFSTKQECMVAGREVLGKSDPRYGPGVADTFICAEGGIVEREHK